MMHPSTPEFRQHDQATQFFRVAVEACLTPKRGHGRVFPHISNNPFAAPLILLIGARKDSPPMTDPVEIPAGAEPEVQHTAPPCRALTLDIELYQAYLDKSDHTDADKRAFVEALWSIIVTFVDLGWGIHPLQETDETCGQLAEIFDPLADTQAEAVEYGETTEEGDAR